MEEGSFGSPSAAQPTRRMNEPNPSRAEERRVQIDPKRVYQRRVALGMFEQGLSFRSVAEHLGLSVWTVRDWHREWKKEKFNVVPTTVRAYREEFRVRVLAEVKDPAMILAVAKRWDLPYATLKIWYDRKVEEEEEKL